MLTIVFYMLGGFVVLGAGAELLVRGSSRLALRLGIKPLIVGLTVVAFGTSAPELAVNIESTVNGLSGLALGNVVGSNIANIGLILGITAIINPITIERDLVRQQIPMVILSSVVLAALLLDGKLGTVDGLLLIVGLIVYLVFSYRHARGEAPADYSTLTPLATRAESGHLVLHTVMIFAGLIMLVAGSQIFVTNTMDLARGLGISEAIIGLTLVAVGTSVPELATSVMAAARKQSDIAIGNVIGSNTFNILCVLGLTASISSINAGNFPPGDILVLLVFTLLLLPFARSGLILTRGEGVLLLLGYSGYIGFLAWSSV